MRCSFLPTQEQEPNGKSTGQQHSGKDGTNAARAGESHPQRHGELHVAAAEAAARDQIPRWPDESKEATRLKQARHHHSDAGSG